MKTLNTRYTTDGELEAFINEHGIDRASQLLVQVFCGVVDEVLIGTLQSFFSAKLPHAHMIGCTTAGEILGGELGECGVVVSFSLFDKTTLASTFVELDGDPREAAKRIADELVTERTKALIVLSDGLKSNGEGLLHAMGEVCGEVVVAGGRAGDNYGFEKSYVFDAKQCSECAAAVVALDSEVLRVYNRYLFNWQCIGKHMRVSRSSGNRVYEIDDKPCLDVYRYYLGDDVADALPGAGIEFPLVFQKEGHQIGRGPIAKFDDGSILFAGEIPEGTNVRFGFGNYDLMNEGAAGLYHELSYYGIESMHIYSCSARKALFGKELEKEFRYLQAVAETIGFITYGEYFHTGGSNELLNITTTVLALSESETVSPRQTTSEPQVMRNTSLKALTHLVNRTSAELELLNRSLEKQVEEEVEKNRQKDHLLLQQTRHAAMGEMVRNIAHQWRQPLNSLAIEMQNIELAYDEQRLDGEYLKKRLEKGMLLIDQMSATIDDFRNFFMPSKAKVLFCINESIRDVLAIMEATFKHFRIDVELNDMDEPIRYVGHENEFSHVILNLLNNAKDAMAASGVAKPRVIIGLKRDLTSFRIEIADNGGGIDPAVMDRIFDPYFTTKQDTNGMGVGLYMSKMIIEEHMGGRLEARNSEAGAVFTITLPQMK